MNRPKCSPIYMNRSQCSPIYIEAIPQIDLPSGAQLKPRILRRRQFPGRYFPKAAPPTVGHHRNEKFRHHIDCRTESESRTIPEYDDVDSNISKSSEAYMSTANSQGPAHSCKTLTLSAPQTPSNSNIRVTYKAMHGQSLDVLVQGFPSKMFCRSKKTTDLPL